MPSLRHSDQWLEGMVAGSVLRRQRSSLADGTDSTTGEFIGHAEGSQLTFNGETLYITYNGGDGNDVVLNTTPVVSGTTGGDTIEVELLASGNIEYTVNGGPVQTLIAPPSFTFNARIDYEIGNGIFANLEAVGSGEYYESNSHQEKRNAFAVFNGAIGYRHEGWTLTLWGKNLFDEAYEKRVFFFDNFHPDDGFVPGSNRRYKDPADPQQFGITANYNW